MQVTIQINELDLDTTPDESNRHNAEWKNQKLIYKVQKLGFGLNAVCGLYFADLGLNWGLLGPFSVLFIMF